MRISNTNITYITDILHNHHQNLISEYLADAAPVATANACAPIVSGPVAMTTLAPDTNFSDTPEHTSIFLSTFPSDIPVEDPTSVPYYEPSDPPSVDPPNFTETSPPDIPSEDTTLVLTSAPSAYPSPDPSSFPSPFPYDLTF